MSNKAKPGGAVRWRSMLFVPAHRKSFIDKAHIRGADALVLDLEDSVPATKKKYARDAVIAAAGKISRNGADVLVRINAGWRLAVRDLEGVVSPSIDAIVVPKVGSAEHLQFIDEIIAELERERGMPQGLTKLVAQIETPGALFKLEAIAFATPRLVALSLGSEDFCSSTGMLPDAESLLFPSQQIVFAARAAGILPLGFVASIADYSDIDAFAKTIQRAKRLGFRGGFCVHPAQIAAMNTAYAPSKEAVQEARAIIAAYGQALAQGHAATEYRGRMIDAPVVARAERLLREIEQGE